MYTDPVQWRRIRKRVLVNGESRGAVSRSEHVHRRTLARMLTTPSPIPYHREYIPRSSQLGEYLQEFQALADLPPAGCKTARDMWRTLTERGCQSSYKSVLYYLRRFQRERAERTNVWARLKELPDREAAAIFRTLVQLPNHAGMDGNRATGPICLVVFIVLFLSPKISDRTGMGNQGAISDAAGVFVWTCRPEEIPVTRMPKDCLPGAKGIN